jgi:hypothetical protein
VLHHDRKLCRKKTRDRRGSRSMLGPQPLLQRGPRGRGAGWAPPRMLASEAGGWAGTSGGRYSVHPPTLAPTHSPWQVMRPRAWVSLHASQEQEPSVSLPDGAGGLTPGCHRRRAWQRSQYLVQPCCGKRRPPGVAAALLLALPQLVCPLVVLLAVVLPQACHGAAVMRAGAGRGAHRAPRGGGSGAGGQHPRRVAWAAHCVGQ